MMKKYLAFTAKAFQRTLTYRFELWMELFINVLFMLIYVYLWKALYTGQTSVEGYDLNGILTYIVVSQTLLTFTFTLRGGTYYRREGTHGRGGHRFNETGRFSVDDARNGCGNFKPYGTIQYAPEILVVSRRSEAVATTITSDGIPFYY